MERKPQTIPVRIFDNEDLILLAAPMPGLEPEILLFRSGITSCKSKARSAARDNTN